MFGPGSGSSFASTIGDDGAFSVAGSGFFRGLGDGFSWVGVGGDGWVVVGGCGWLVVDGSDWVWLATLVLGVSTGIPSDTPESPPKSGESNTGESASPMVTSPDSSGRAMPMLCR